MPFLDSQNSFFHCNKKEFENTKTRSVMCRGQVLFFSFLPKLGTISTTIHQSMTWNEVGDIIYQISTQKELCRMYSSLTTQCSRKLDKRRKKNVDSREQFQLLENQFFSSKSQSCFCVQLTILDKLSSCICKFFMHVSILMITQSNATLRVFEL